jgi:serine/threonine protein kinase
VLQRATNEFDDQNVIGSGGFGKVYLGVLKDGTEVAVKRKNDSQQGAEQFQVEMEVLSRLKHPNLVSLIGSCDQNDEMILVYEYMEGGTLKSHLYGSTGKPSLSWKQRLEVCVGAAKGLHYLHTRTGTIHRDVKPENILLDGNLCAKIGDFGLSRTGPELNQTHVITRVMGTFGYIDPQHFKTGQLSMKSDVYSFGVVLLEVISGRSVIDYRLSAEKVSLVTWGKKMLEEGEVEEIVDKKILGTIHPHNLAMFGGIVLRCLAEESAERPTMEEVLSNLEWELDCVRAEEEVAAGNSDDDESDHAISSQPILHGGGKALRRSEGKNYDRYSGVSHHAGLSAPSTSLGVGGNPMKGKGAVELESIIEDENSYYI